MKVSSMRLLERWIGVPLCLILTAARKIGDLRRLISRRPIPQHASAILLVKLEEMGSTVLALPMIRRLQELYPTARFYYLCLDGNEAVLDLFRDLPVEACTIRATSAWSLLVDGVRAIWKIRRQHVELAISLEVFSRAAAALAYLSGARSRVGFHRFHAEGCNCGDLYTHRVLFNPYLHLSAGFLTLAEALTRPGGEVPLVKARIETPQHLDPMTVDQAERRAVLEKLGQRGYPLDRRPPILILNANSSDLFPLRRWPALRFVQLGRLCLESYDELWVVLTGGPLEAAGIEKLAQDLNHPRAISLAGHTTLRELVVLFGLGAVLITNDSGPAQFAALTSIAVLTLFGPETPALYGPLSPRNRSLSAGLACSPCINVFNQRQSACADNQCLQALSVQNVFDAFDRTFRSLQLGQTSLTQPMDDEQLRIVRP